MSEGYPSSQPNQYPTPGNNPYQGVPVNQQPNMPLGHMGQPFIAGPPQPYPGWGPSQAAYMSSQRHDIPRCTQCGTITPWRVESIFLARHFLIGGLLLLFFGAGLFYFLTVAIIRGNANSRAKICPNCGAHNLWTFIY